MRSVVGYTGRWIRLGRALSCRANYVDNGRLAAADSADMNVGRDIQQIAAERRFLGSAVRGSLASASRHLPVELHCFLLRGE